MVARTRRQIPPSARILAAVALVAADVAVGLLAGLLVLREFQIWTTLDSLPPICANWYGDTMDCTINDGWVLPAAFVTVGVVAGSLFAIERRFGWI